MSKRLALIMMLAFIPCLATADDTAPSTGLGPDTIAPSAGGSVGDAGALQPAGIAPIQATTGDSAGLTAPTGNSLQAPATSDEALKVIAGDADGAPQDFEESSTPSWPWAGLVVMLLIFAGAGIVWRDRRRFARSEAATRP